MGSMAGGAGGGDVEGVRPWNGVSMEGLEEEGNGFTYRLDGLLRAAGGRARVGRNAHLRWCWGREMPGGCALVEVLLRIWVLRTAGL